VTPAEIRRLALRAFSKAFRVPQRDIDRDVWEPELDPGRWSPTSLLVVHTEGILRDPYTYNTQEKWDKVENALREKLGNVYFESINCAVWALYRV
jgi:hypothetical protein